ncbi:type II toxin-antitoxin system prevent-host-death family antitoxin [Crystallibacter crystallopoietes]|uniref:type II toxin-antitoxin system prevent-host-death family antitoxin n=1 Tax=Crystallibacter crystallopoietes TaxID=37928 RepID=UPI0005C17B18|nr:type II toxin-antitoxin system prevent-host-death family antitoxin [Arthrobacter crystallopoietes]
MRSVPSNEARQHWAELLDAVRSEPVSISRRGRDVAAVVDIAFFRRAVEALEDAEDIEAAKTARQETEPTVSHEALLAELGIEV